MTLSLLPDLSRLLGGSSRSVNSRYSRFNLLFRLLAAPFRKPRHNAALQFCNGHIFARKELARGDGVEIFIVDARRAGYDIPPATGFRPR